MFGDKIEQMKRDFTDKYVLVDGTRPELARFRDVVGRVKTVNMNGRALVEFDEYHLNVGWYDIAPEFLKVVDKPPPKEKKIEAKKPAAKVEVNPAAAKPAAPAKGGKPSVAEMLAAARSGGAAKAGGAAPAPAKAKEAPAVAEPAGAKVDRSKMSVADMLAAARSGGAAGAAPAAAKAAALAAPAEEAPAPVPAKKAASAVAKATEKVDKSKMSIDDMVAWCREHDAK
jgi:hypothetical protein